MCWVLLAIGLALLAVGTSLLVRFFAARGPNDPERAGAGRTETMIVGALMASIGLLVTLLGVTGAFCERFGIA